MSAAIRVLVVDDSAYSRQTLKKMLEKDPDIEVAGVATDGLDAMAKTLRLSPDLITLDFEMPQMDGFSFLRWLMQQKPTPVIMVSSNSEKRTVFQALELGAMDFIVKPSKRASVELLSIERDLLAKVKGVEDLNLEVLSSNLRRMDQQGEGIPRRTPPEAEIDLVAIGSSTGGPTALQTILSGLPADFPAGVVISQHMPKGFTRPLAERLDKMVGLFVKEAEDGEEVRKGVVLICPGGHHAHIKRKGKKVCVSLREAVLEDKYVPSVDVMLRSASEVYEMNMMGVVLTGMGSDGREGMLEVKGRGGYTIAESEETAVVFGMPAEVIRAGAARSVVPLFNISREMIKIVMGDSRV